jgi:hypothetical protein
MPKKTLVQGNYTLSTQKGPKHSSALAMVGSKTTLCHPKLNVNPESLMMLQDMTSVAAIRARTEEHARTK